MPYYLVQATYTHESWAAMVKNPQDRTEAIKPVIEKLGGTLKGIWLSFGDYDAIALVEMPDNTSAAAFSLAAAATGSVKAFKTTPLMTVAEGMKAMKQAGGIGYRPPT